MSNNKNMNTFNPDYAIHPGEILEDTLIARDMKKNELADRIGMSPKTISLIINGKERITPETAIKLERVLGISASLWNNLDAIYELHKAKEASRKNIEHEISFIKNFPVRELIKRGFLTQTRDETKLYENLLSFFSIASFEGFREHYYRNLLISYRQSPSFQSDEFALLSWLQMGELIQRNIQVKPYDRVKFISVLGKVRELTKENFNVFRPKIEKICSESGVALVLLPEPNKTRVSGAVRWVSKDKALIMMSLRHKREDQFWFTFFHEAFHILKHSKKKLFISEDENTALTDEEREANEFASRFLIQPALYQEFIRKQQFSRINITNFAKKINISPGIVVGRLQHDGHIDWKDFNDLVKKFEF